MDAKKSSKAEEEYFARLEVERRKKAAEELNKKRSEEEIRKTKAKRKRLKELHWMRCPKCGQELEEITFRGVKIDKCKGCSGIWLDPGELEILAGKEKGLLGIIIKSFRYQGG